MFGTIIGGILFIIALYILFGPKKQEVKKEKNKKETKTQIKTKNEEKKVMPPIKAEKEKEKEEPSIDISKYLFKTIKDCNSMSKCYFYKNGQVILFCDEKKISLCIFKTSFNDTPKIYNKTIEKDLITDICLSLDKKTIYCSNKNSKMILFYTLEKVDGKIKLVKLDKNIICNRPYEIRSIVCDKLGTLIFSIGTNDDTEIQIFDAISSELKFKESTSAIQNLQMEMGPNDSDLLISTFMNDISVLNLEKNDKFNSETKKYENIYKFKRTSSIPVKAKPLFYMLSNDDRFFIVVGDDKSVKIFRNYGNISESKIYTQINLEFNANKATLYVDSFENGKLDGYVGISKENDIVIYNTKGEVYLELPGAHNGEILKMFITKENNDLILISAGNDGKIKFWKI